MSGITYLFAVILITKTSGMCFLILETFT